MPALKLIHVGKRGHRSILGVYENKEICNAHLEKCITREIGAVMIHVYATAGQNEINIYFIPDFLYSYTYNISQYENFNI